MTDRERRQRSAGGRGSRRVPGAAAAPTAPAFIRRQIPTYELLGEEGLALIETKADELLAEVGIEVHDDVAVGLFRDAGATVDGQRVRFDPGHVRALCATAPSTFTQVARNPAHTVEIGGDAVVFAPAYGSPFVRDLAGGRRYGSMADFENFVKLAWSIPWLHHSGGTVCEPVDVPVNKRHLDMVYAHLRYSDKPFMGSVTVPSRAEDSIEMARIAFGAEFVEANCVILGNVNVNSPLVWDGAMTGAIRAYAGANQAPVVVPFILGGAMGPVTLAGDIAQAHAETMVGVALGQLTRPGSPVVYGNFLSSMALRSGRADVRHARAGHRVARRRPARPPGRAAAALLGLVHDVEGARRAGDAGVGGLDAGGDPVRRQLHPPLGGLARGRAGHGVREVRRRRRPLRRAAPLPAGHRPVRRGVRPRRVPRGRPGQALLRRPAHAAPLRDRVLGQLDGRQLQLRAVARRRRAAGRGAGGRQGRRAARRLRTTADR